MSRARIFALSFVAALALSSAALAQGGGGGGGAGGGGAGGGAAVEQAVLAVEALTAEQAAPAAPTLLNPPVAKAVRVAIRRPNLPAARARIALIPQGRELGRGAPVPA